MSALCQKRTHAPQQNTDRLGQNRADEIGLTLVFNEGVRAIATAGGFCVPLALVIRKHAVDLISPATVVLDKHIADAASYWDRTGILGRVLA